MDDALKEPEIQEPHNEQEEQPKLESDPFNIEV